MRKTMLIVILFIVASVTKAELIDNFDSYAARDELGAVAAWELKGSSADQTIRMTAQVICITGHTAALTGTPAVPQLTWAIMLSPTVKLQR